MVQELENKKKETKIKDKIRNELIDHCEWNIEFYTRRNKQLKEELQKEKSEIKIEAKTEAIETNEYKIQHFETFIKAIEKA